MLIKAFPKSPGATLQTKFTLEAPTVISKFYTTKKKAGVEF